MWFYYYHRTYELLLLKMTNLGYKSDTLIRHSLQEPLQKECIEGCNNEYYHSDKENPWNN